MFIDWRDTGDWKWKREEVLPERVGWDSASGQSRILLALTQAGSTGISEPGDRRDV